MSVFENNPAEVLAALGKDSAETYEEKQARISAAQAGLSQDQVMSRMARRSEFAMDLNNLPGQQHNWVDRGAVMSCEGADHDNHRYYKRIR